MGTLQSETKISEGHQVVVPATLRRKHGLSPGDVLVWEDRGDSFRVVPRKRVTLADITGIGRSGGADAVEAKRRIQRGRR